MSQQDASSTGLATLSEVPGTELRQLRATFESFREFVSRYSPWLSDSCIFVETHESVPVGAPVRLEIWLRDRPILIRALGQVDWVREEDGEEGPPGVALNINYLDAASARLIDSIFRLYAGQQSAPMGEKVAETWETDVELLIDDAFPGAAGAQAAAQGTAEEPPQAPPATPRLAPVAAADEEPVAEVTAAAEEPLAVAEEPAVETPAVEEEEEVLPAVEEDLAVAEEPLAEEPAVETPAVEEEEEVLPAMEEDLAVAEEPLVVDEEPEAEALAVEEEALPVIEEPLAAGEPVLTADEPSAAFAEEGEELEIELEVDEDFETAAGTPAAEEPEAEAPEEITPPRPATAAAAPVTPSWRAAAEAADREPPAPASPALDAESESRWEDNGAAALSEAAASAPELVEEPSFDFGLVEATEPEEVAVELERPAVEAAPASDVPVAEELSAPASAPDPMPARVPAPPASRAPVGPAGVAMSTSDRSFLNRSVLLFLVAVVVAGLLFFLLRDRWVPGPSPSPPVGETIASVPAGVEEAPAPGPETPLPAGPAPAGPAPEDPPEAAPVPEPPALGEPAVAEPAGEDVSPETAPAPSAATEPRLDPEASAADVERLVRSWAAAWSAQEPEKYIACYAPGYSPPGLSREEWESQRRARIRAPGSILVEPRELAVEILDAGRARAVFYQDYQTDATHLFTWKTMQIERLPEGWRIVEERTGR